MTNRSPAVSLALLIVPTMCIVALRFGIPALDEVISNDFTLEATLHVIAILVGLFMVTSISGLLNTLANRFGSQNLPVLLGDPLMDVPHRSTRIL